MSKPASDAGLRRGPVPDRARSTPALRATVAILAAFGAVVLVNGIVAIGLIALLQSIGSWDVEALIEYLASPGLPQSGRSSNPPDSL